MHLSRMEEEDQLRELEQQAENLRGNTDAEAFAQRSQLLREAHELRTTLAATSALCCTEGVPHYQPAA